MKPKEIYIQNPVTPAVVYAEVEDPPRVGPTLQEAVRAIAEREGVSWETVNNLVTSESRWNPNAYNEKTKDRGLFQINEDAWPDITDEQAFDPLWSAEWAINHIKEGREYYWVVCSCVKYQLARGHDMKGVKTPQDIERGSMPQVGGLVILEYNVWHVAEITKITPQGFFVTEANFEPCLIGERFVSWSDDAIRGFSDPPLN